MPKWYSEKKEEIEKRKEEYKKRILDSPDAAYLPEYPVDRHRERDRAPWKQRETIQKIIKFKRD